jgi:hypothetical protein
MSFLGFERSVRDTSELQRVLDLPVRELSEDYADSLVDEWTSLLVTDAGRAEGARLGRWQAVALAEAYEQRGLWASLAVGIGKTLLGWLIPTVLDSRRPVLIAPSGLHKEIRKEWALYARHWIAPRPPPTLLSYQELDREEGLTRLETLAPDLVMLDESHKARREDRVATRRIARYSDATKRAYYDGNGPWVPMCCWTGTPGRLSILDFAPHLIWTLGERAPVPMVREECEQWASAIDDRPGRPGTRVFGVGALRRLVAEFGEEDAADRDLVDACRGAFRNRLVTSPGVVIVSEDSCKQPLAIEQIVAPPCPVIEENFRRFRVFNETPGGEVVSDPLQGFRLEGELSVGYHGEWDPPAPEEWRLRRKAWHDECRELIDWSQSRTRPWDSPAAVARANPDLESLVRWNEIKDTFTIDPKPVWHSGSVVEWVAGLLRDGPPTLCFAWSIPFLEALAYVTGLTWYANKGYDARGRYVGDAPADTSALVSGMANLEGRNLQQFNEFLYVVPPQSGQWLEQAFGRGHRQKQTRPVRIRMAITSGGIADGFEKALREAHGAGRTWGANQKITRAQITRAPFIAGHSPHRFKRKVEAFDEF